VDLGRLELKMAGNLNISRNSLKSADDKAKSHLRVDGNLCRSYYARLITSWDLNSFLRTELFSQN
jgi:hypothetical protein